MITPRLRATEADHTQGAGQICVALLEEEDCQTKRFVRLEPVQPHHMTHFQPTQNSNAHREATIKPHPTPPPPPPVLQVAQVLVSSHRWHCLGLWTRRKYRWTVRTHFLGLAFLRDSAVEHQQHQQQQHRATTINKRTERRRRKAKRARIACPTARTMTPSPIARIRILTRLSLSSIKIKKNEKKHQNVTCLMFKQKYTFTNVSKYNLLLAFFVPLSPSLLHTLFFVWIHTSSLTLSS